MTTSMPSAGPIAPRTSSWRGNLRRGGVVVVIGIVIGLFAAVVVTAVAHKSYTATTRVLVTSTGVDDNAQNANGRTTTTINPDTEAQLVTSAAVVQAATEAYPRLSKQTFQHLVDSIAITVPPNTTILQIAFTDDSAASAQAGANALASAYLTNRQTTAQGSLDGEIANAKDNVSTLTDELETLSIQAQTAVATKAYLESRITLVKSEITAVNSQLVTLNNIQITPGQVVTAANRPTSPSSPSRVINLASGVGIGLLLGVLVAWLLIRFRRTVQTQDDLARAVDVPCIAVLPPQEPGATISPRSAANYRRVALIASSAVEEPAVLVVTAPLLSASSSRLATGVAASMAHGGTTAALLQVHDLDIARPRGVSTTRVRQADDLVSDSGESIPEALERVRGRHAVIVVDVPGATLDADAQTLAAHADAVLLVVDAGTPIKLVREALEDFDILGAPILGTVLIGRSKSTRDRPAEDLAALHGSSAYRDRAPSRDGAHTEQRPSDDADPASSFRSSTR